MSPLIPEKQSKYAIIVLKEESKSQILLLRVLFLFPLTPDPRNESIPT